MSNIFEDQMELEERILELIDMSDEMTRSDLQGAVGAIAREYKKIKVEREVWLDTRTHQLG